MMNEKECDIVVIGLGIAGLLTARLLHDKGCRVILAGASSFGGGASFFPLKGTLGVQVTGNSNDKSLFEEDFLRVANGNIDKAKMDVYIQESAGKQELLRLIGFDPRLRQDKRPACFAKYSRPIYLIDNWDDARTKARSIFQERNIEILEHARAIKIFKNQNQQVSGALFIDSTGYTLIRAKAVVLAGGGVSGLFQHKLYPQDTDGSSWTLASDAGASLINAEFIQFIPGFLSPKYNVLFGEHTIKYLKNVYDSDGNDLFSDLSPAQKKQLFFDRSSYAPFSVDFPSCIFDIRLFQAGEKGVRLEYDPALYEDTEDFYQVYLKWLSTVPKINLLADKPVITPFAHASNGGIEITPNGETSVSGLYAVGEASCGVEGANRMGGNSVGGILVFAPRLAEKASAYIHTVGLENSLPATEFLHNIPLRPNSPSPTEIKQKLAVLLQQHASIIRTKQGLENILSWVTEMESLYSPFPLYETSEGFSALSALSVAKLLSQKMLARTQSVGAHYREDTETILNNYQ